MSENPHAQNPTSAAPRSPHVGGAPQQDPQAPQHVPSADHDVPQQPAPQHQASQHQASQHQAPQYQAPQATGEAHGSQAVQTEGDSHTGTALLLKKIGSGLLVVGVILIIRNIFSSLEVMSYGVDPITAYFYAPDLLFTILIWASIILPIAGILCLIGFLILVSKKKSH